MTGFFLPSTQEKKYSRAFSGMAASSLSRLSTDSDCPPWRKALMVFRLTPDLLDSSVPVRLNSDIVCLNALEKIEAIYGSKRQGIYPSFNTPNPSLLRKRPYCSTLLRRSVGCDQRIPILIWICVDLSLYPVIMYVNQYKIKRN
jgi:hypothetical protein